MTYTELYNICHDEAVAYANSEQWSKRTGEEKSFLIQGYLDAMMETRKSEITKKRKEYPKTYEECCAELNNYPFENGVDGYKFELLSTFQNLIICRDAYWKIAGEEMGLGKPWEPDWENSEERRYCIVNINGEINLPEKILTKWILKVTNKILVFPTEEMRDAFYDKFKYLIEKCKELL